MTRVRPFSFRRLIFVAGAFSLIAVSGVMPWHLAPRAAVAAEAADDQPGSAKQHYLIHPIAGSWTITDPDKDCEVRLIGDKLSITVPATNHDLNPLRGMNAPRVLKKVKGDFTVRVKLTADFKPGTTSTGKGSPFNGAGILLWQNEENFLRVERNAFWLGETLHCYPPIMEYYHHGKYSGANNDLTGADYFQGRSTWLKVQRLTKDIAVSISHDGRRWNDVKTFPVQLAEDELLVGVAALNTSDTPFTVDFEELTMAPLVTAPDEIDKSVEETRLINDITVRNGAEIKEDVVAGRPTKSRDAIVRYERPERPVSDLAGQQAKPPDATNTDLIKPGDWLRIEVVGTLPHAPIQGPYRVEASGKVALGPDYGRVEVNGKTLEQAEASVSEYLATMLAVAKLQITRYEPPPRPTAVEAIERRVDQLEKEVRRLQMVVPNLPK